ncbi:uncharacterized protein [Coffea arabica]|uniref:Uncharacterized protein n=1 Tax=Coffea arabica TaxID=13443 RepID=A0A6P6WXM2_COFAR|nr:uncharacterized protein LOC113737140 [Coffea arabica]
MSSKSPIFPVSEPQHFSDYGFDPQIDYFQVLEEARRHKRETSSRSSSSIAIDALHFKLQKPISKDDYSSSKKKIKKNKKRWWKNALLFFSWKWTSRHSENALEYGVHGRRAIRASISGPVYVTESRSGSSTPFRTTSRPSSGPLAGTLTPADKDEVQIPYISLREFNMDHQHQQHSVPTSAVPIYLVT